MTREDGRTEVRIGLPLPIDVASSIGNAVDAMYPGTSIDTTAPRDTLTLLLPEGSRRPKRLSKKALAALKQDQPEEAEDVLFDGFGSDEEGVTARVLAPQEATAHLAVLVRAMFRGQPEGTNYLEAEVSDRADGTRYVVIGCRSPERTPNALRQQAEQRATAAEQERDALRASIAAVLARSGPVSRNDLKALIR